MPRCEHRWSEWKAGQRWNHRLWDPMHGEVRSCSICGLDNWRPLGRRSCLAFHHWSEWVEAGEEHEMRHCASCGLSERRRRKW